MKYDLVFEGGGAKGMVFVGAYEEFVKSGHSFGRLLGTSAGAITAVLIAAGYTPQEMFEALNEKKDGKSVFAGFMGKPAPFSNDDVKKSAIRELLRNVNLKFIPDLIEEKMDNALAKWMAHSSRWRHFFSFVERGGWYAADNFTLWLQSKLDTGIWENKQRNFSAMTLKEFFDVTQVDLSMVASDTTESRLLVLNCHTAPECPLVWAVRMSMSIPLVWEEVIWKEEWGNYQNNSMSGHVIVDGGMLSNFPIELFISDEPQVIKLMGPKQDVPVLGFLIDETLPVQPAQKGILVEADINVGELETVKRFKRLVDTITSAHDKMVIEEFDHLVVRLPAGGYGTTKFDMSDERRDALVQAGRDAMGAYLDNPPASSTLQKGIKGAPLRTPADRIAARLLGL